jgi:serine/threonine protein kinase
MPGPYLCFAGAAWNNRPNLQILSVLPFHFHFSDTRFKMMAARQLRASTRAINHIKHFYEDEYHTRNPPSPNQSQPQPMQLFPYPTSFTSLVDSKKQSFVYYSHLDNNKLIFRAKLCDGSSDLCVKFVHQYSKEVHEYCASIDAAPKLLGFEDMPGGWYMVVMTFIEGYDMLHESESLIPTDKIRAVIHQLHQRGYVHGDIRDTNVMVSSNGHVILLDFDWAGEGGKVQYPMNTHYGNDLWRPEEARDGMLITCEHDIEMMDAMFEALQRDVRC